MTCYECGAPDVKVVCSQRRVHTVIYHNEGVCSQWYDAVDFLENHDHTCSVCGGEGSEHNWEIHAAEMKAEQSPY
jgi:hypothetical protein